MGLKLGLNEMVAVFVFGFFLVVSLLHNTNLVLYNLVHRETSKTLINIYQNHNRKK